jgi:hypothetical protein
MKKIPTLFVRGEDFKVVNKLTSGCEWVFDHQGVATEKLDGMNIRVTIWPQKRGPVRMFAEKRRSPNKRQKKQGIVESWYVPVTENSEDKRLWQAVYNTDMSGWPAGTHYCEAIGPKIQGNPLGLTYHVCVPFDWIAPLGGSDLTTDYRRMDLLKRCPIHRIVDMSYEGLRQQFMQLESKFSPGHPAEGIVFHHPDGRQVKLKRKDFTF